MTNAAAKTITDLSNNESSNKVADLVRVLNNPSQAHRLDNYDSKQWIKTFCSENNPLTGNMENNNN